MRCIIIEYIYKKTRAKINLFLNILDKREDGYHNLESIIQSISLYDEIYIRKNQDNCLNLICSDEEIKNEENIIYKAYNLLKDKFDNITGIDVKLVKHIPKEAGLGGGSSNCANFLVAMNELFELDLSTKNLIDISKSLGADVPVCLDKGTFHVQGIGEKLSKISNNLSFYLVIVHPDFRCNTGKMFKKLDELRENFQTKTNKDINKVIDNIKQNESEKVDEISKELYNTFEEVIDFKEELTKIKNELIDLNAVASLMTGAGSCIFGIFNNRNDAKNAFNNLKLQYNTYYCKSIN